MNRVIISDTSCLIALSKIDKLKVLNNLYQNVVVTKEVYNEYGAKLPDWISVVEVKNKQKQKEIEVRLDKGEASSIALALELENATLIIDEIKGRKIARSLNIEIIRTIGLLLLAEKKGVIKNAFTVIMKMVNKGFRLSDSLLEKLIERYGD